MILSDEIKKQAGEFVRAKGIQMLTTRQIPEIDVGVACIIINEMELGFIDDGLAVRKIKAIKNVKSLDADIKKFWDTNEAELEAIIAMENV